MDKNREKDEQGEMKTGTDTEVVTLCIPFNNRITHSKQNSTITKNKLIKHLVQ
jgi:hypothetical protein